MWSINLEGVEFYGFHGVSDAEQQVGHRYLVNVSVSAHLKDPASDDVSKTIDYGDLAVLVVDFGTSHQFRTLEKLAWEMSSAIFQEFRMATEIEISIDKLAPPIPVIVGTAGVRLVRERGGKA